MILRRFIFTVLCAALLGLSLGCKTEEPSNRSARPWNSPKGWENGLPVGLTEGR
jgi:hypothetical protein